VENVRIAVLGGSFNPPHYGHLLVAREVLKNFECDEVWLLPCFKQAEGKPLAPAEDRLAMLRLAWAELSPSLRKKIKVKDFEIRLLRRKNYTADTVRFLQKRFPQHSFYWVFGSELVSGFPRWVKWRELRKLIPLLIYPRPGVRKPSKKFLEKLGAKLVWLPWTVERSGISSTLVRKLLRSDSAKARALVPPGVFGYLVKRKLYG